MRPQRGNNVIGGLGWPGRFPFGRGGWPLVFTSATGLIRGFSPRDRAGADHHVGQSKQRVEVMPVFGQPPVTHLAVAEDVFDDVEGMLDEGSHRGFGFLQCLERFFLRAFNHRFDRPAFAGDLPVNFPLHGRNLRSLLHSGVARRQRGLAAPARAAVARSG